MAKVWADNEEVVFDGDIPEDSQRIYELMMGALAEQRKAVVEFIVDGEDALVANSFPANFTEIKAVSMTHDEITMRLTKATMARVENLESEIGAYAQNILSTAWSEVFKQMDEFISKIQPFADLVDNVSPYSNAYSPPWSTRLQEISSEQAGTLGSVLKCFEQGNVAGLSDEITIHLVPLVRKISKFFSKEVVPQLEQIVKGQANPA